MSNRQLNNRQVSVTAWLGIHLHAWWQPQQRKLKPWMLAVFVATLALRLIMPITVPPLVVHANGYIEICSNGGFTRIMLDSQGQEVASQQEPSYCPVCLAGPEPQLVDCASIERVNFTAPEAAYPCVVSWHPTLQTLPPPTRAPPWV